LFTWFSKFTKPEDIGDLKEKEQLAFLSTLIRIAVIASLVYGGIVLAFINEDFLSLSIPFLVIFSGGLSAIFIHKGYLKVATYLFMLGTWLTFTVTSVALFGGLTSPTISLYVLIIFTVGLMMGVKPAFFFAGLTVLSVTLMYLGELFDLMPAPIFEANPFRTLFVHLINLTITTVLVRQAVQDINKSKAKEHKRTLELEKFISSMEETIARRTYELSEQKIFFETLFTNIPAAVVFVDPDNVIVACNRSFEELFGYQQSEVLNKVLDPLVTTEETLTEAENYTRQTQLGTHTQAICKRKRKDGSLVDVEMQGVPIMINGTHFGALAIYRDITESLLAEEALKANEARFRSLFEDSPISLWEEDFSGVKDYLDQLRKMGVSNFQDYFHKYPEVVVACAKKIRVLNVNQATVSLFKAGSKDDLLTGISDVLIEESWDVFKEELTALAEGDSNFACEIHQRRFDGETIIGALRLSIASGYKDTWEKVYVSIQDITERINLESRLKESLAKMEILATTDPLTGLLNRRAIIDSAEAELARAAREGKTLGLALVDMDNLKDINDQHGHMVGDSALRLLGETLKRTSRVYDKVGRWGGDEFLVVIPLVDSDSLIKIVARLKDAINGTKLDLLNGDQLWLQVCIGITCAPEGNKGIKNIDQLLNVADEALYKAKALGRNQIAFLDSHQGR